MKVKNKNPFTRIIHFLFQGSKYDLINTQSEDLIEKNNQLHRTIKDTELLNESLHQKINDYEFVLSTTREKLENIQMNLQEKVLFKFLIKIK